ncbi:cytochrome p450, partial [Trifolium pratense]
DGWHLEFDLEDKAPPRVRNLLWRICRRCVPTHVNLRSRGVNCTTQARPGVMRQRMTTEIKWKKSANERVKCNIDASFSSLNNRVGIGVCIRDEKDAFVVAKLDQFSPICDVRV